MGKAEDIPGILIKSVLGALDYKPEEHCPIPSEDADKNGHDQAGDVLIKTVLILPFYKAAKCVFFHGESE